MPLQNRVDPFGMIHSDPARGLFTGNRGVIHDPDTRTLLRRRWTTRAWLICECAFAGRRRDVMGRNGRSGGAGWTELFFLDEVTALAAGHRPCFFCRRAAARCFMHHFAAATNRTGASAPLLDAQLHGERQASGASPRRIDAPIIRTLPDGAMLAIGRQAFALREGHFLPWHFAGYGPALGALPRGDVVVVLTPASTLAVLASGYRPVWHVSAGS